MMIGFALREQTAHERRLVRRVREPLDELSGVVIRERSGGLQRQRAQGAEVLPELLHDLGEVCVQVDPLVQ